jgi:hypothetical protein
VARDYLTVADVLGMHSVLMQRYGGAPGVRDPGVSGILCKRGGHQILERRSPNSMVNRVSAAFQSRMGMDHF